MLRSIAGAPGTVVLGTLLGTGAPTGAVAQEQDSGFLRDYSRLEESTDSTGRVTRKWESPRFTPDNYHALLLDPVVFYPELRPTDQVGAGTLQQILAYTNELAKRAATGGAPQHPTIVVEIEVTDSMSGELLAARVRFGTGEQRLAKIEEKDVITLETVRPLLDNLAGQIYPDLQAHVKPR